VAVGTASRPVAVASTMMWRPLTPTPNRRGGTWRFRRATTRKLDAPTADPTPLDAPIASHPGPTPLVRIRLWLQPPPHPPPASGNALPATPPTQPTAFPATPPLESTQAPLAQTPEAVMRIRLWLQAPPPPPPVCDMAAASSAPPLHLATPVAGMRTCRRTLSAKERRKGCLGNVTKNCA
jgi:hypothetical protein